MNYFVEFKEDANSFLRKNVDLTRYTSQEKWSVHDWIEVRLNDFLTDKAIAKLEILEPMDYAYLFRLDPFATAFIHNDTDSNGNLMKFGMNWVLQGEGTMEWFLPKEMHNVESNDKSPYPSWSEDVAGPVVECWTGQNALVRTDIAHRVINHGEKPRLCFAVKFHSNDWDKAIEWTKRNRLEKFV